MEQTAGKVEVDALDPPKPSLHSIDLTTQIGALTLSRDFEVIISALGSIQVSVNEAGLIAESRNEVLLNMYASLPAILKALAPYLKSNGVTMLQPYEVNGKSVRVTTIFLKGKQFVSMSATMNADNEYPQAIGSAVTYCCRYSIRALLGLAVDGPGDQDDDGNSASGTSSDSGKGSGTQVKDPAKVSASSKVQASKQTPSKEREGASTPAGYSDVLRGYLKKVESSDLAGLTSAESQVTAFKLTQEEQDILLKAIRERKVTLAPSSALFEDDKTS